MILKWLVMGSNPVSEHKKKKKKKCSRKAHCAGRIVLRNGSTPTLHCCAKHRKAPSVGRSVLRHSPTPILFIMHDARSCSIMLIHKRNGKHKYMAICLCCQRLDLCMSAIRTVRTPTLI
jgi:hypothetical protein